MYLKTLLHQVKEKTRLLPCVLFTRTYLGCRLEFSGRQFKENIHDPQNLLMFEKALTGKTSRFLGATYVFVDGETFQENVVAKSLSRLGFSQNYTIFDFQIALKVKIKLWKLKLSLIKDIVWQSIYNTRNPQNVSNTTTSYWWIIPIFSSC